MPASSVAITTVGASVKYCVETTAGTRPTTGYTELVGVSSAPEIAMTPETIDVSTIKDLVTKYAQGRQDPGGTATFQLVHSEAAIETWETHVSAATTGLTTGKKVWYEYAYPNANKSFFFSGMPLALGNGGIEQNAADLIPANVIPNGVDGWQTAST